MLSLTRGMRRKKVSFTCWDVLHQQKSLRLLLVLCVVSWDISGPGALNRFRILALLFMFSIALCVYEASYVTSTFCVLYNTVCSFFVYVSLAKDFVKDPKNMDFNSESFVR